MSTAPNGSTPLDRYARQTLFAGLGAAGQERLARSRVLVCGCGALGTTAVNLLVRAGVGNVRIIDRDAVEITNLHRLVLFEERDAAESRPKALAATEKLRCINSEVKIEPIVGILDRTNVDEIFDGVDAIVDALDNFETRFLVNEAAVRRKIPWVYGGVVASYGQTMTIIPGQTACLQCLMPECPPPGSTPTIYTAGVIGPIVSVIASIEVAEALKLLSGNANAVSRNLTVIDLWDNSFHQIDVSRLRERVACPICK